MAIVEISDLKTKFEPGDNPGRQDYLNLIDTLAATPDISGKQDIVSGVSSTEIGYLDGVTSAIQTQLDAKASQANLDLKAALSSPTLLGTPLAPTATAGTNTTQIATTAFVKTAVDNVVAAAPGALDTLDELALALNDDASFATTITNSLAGKVSISGGSTITASGAAVIPVIAKGAASQTADLQQWQNSAGTVLAKVDASGNLTVGNTTGTIQIKSTGTSAAYPSSGSGIELLAGTSAGVDSIITYNRDTSAWRGLNLYSSPIRMFNAGTELFTIAANGSIGINNPTVSSVTLGVISNSASNVTLALKGAASQTADLQQWVNSAGTVLSQVYASGNARFSSGTASGQFLITSDLGNSSWFGIYNSSTSKYYGISAQLPSPAGTITLGGYYDGVGVGGATHNTNSPIFAVVTSTNATPTTAPIITYDTGETRLRAQSAGYTPLKVFGAASQTANLQEWQNSAGTVLAKIRQDGVFSGSYFDGINASGTYIQAGSGMDFVARGTDSATVRVLGAASQTANLQEWKNSSNTLLSAIDIAGNFTKGDGDQMILASQIFG
jgi:hypothetical protein